MNWLVYGAFFGGIAVLGARVIDTWPPTLITMIFN